MTQIVFLANAKSPHTNQWASIIGNKHKIIIFDIHSIGPVENPPENIQVIRPLPNFTKYLPKVLQYFFLGLCIRFSSVLNTQTIHTHNTSGYGFSAFISGKPFGVTTYGSEIFGSEKKSKLYNWLIRRILHKATWITGTTPEMEKALIDRFAVAPAKINTFSLGVDPGYFSAKPKRKSTDVNNITWFVNRRIHPHYDTLNLVQGFLAYCKEGGSGNLMLTAGDADKEYLLQVQSVSSESSNIQIIEKFLNKDEMIELLDKSDFAISVPFSDQLSSAILEASARGVIPVLRQLPSYEELESISISVSGEGENSVHSYAKLFHQTANMSEQDRRKQSRNVSNFLVENYGAEAIYNKVIALYK